MGKKKRCNKYRSCKHVPSGSCMNECFPSYTFSKTINSRNWCYCNMSNWGKHYKKYKRFCKPENNCTLKKTKITKNTVDARILHSKMPYIWRFLKPNTRKQMIKLANKPVESINIPFDIFPGKNLQSSKNIKKVTKNMSKKNKKLYRKLRQKYKDI